MRTLHDQADEPGNGILASIPGAVIGGATRLIPEPSPDQPKRMTVDVLADHMGPVRLTYELHSYRFRRNVLWSWRGVHAEALPDDSTCVPIPHSDYPWGNPGWY